LIPESLLSFNPNRGEVLKFNRLKWDGMVIGPHANTFMIHKKDFGNGYDEDFCGHYGSDDTYFFCCLKHLKIITLTDPQYNIRVIEHYEKNYSRDTSFNKALMNKKLKTQNAYIDKNGIKYTFCHIPKTGGGSICLALGIKSIGHHVAIPCPGKFIFCFIRNPFDRLVSTYHYLSNNGKNAKDQEDAKLYIDDCSFEDFVKKSVKQGSKEQIHLRPQVYFIPNGADFIGRFNHIVEDFNKLTDIIGIERRALPHVRKSDHGHFSEYFKNIHVLKIVEDVYQDDIDLYCRLNNMKKAAWMCGIKK
jgi:hypothetical protein